MTVPVDGKISHLLQLHDRARVLFLLALLLVEVRVQFNMPDGQAERDGTLYGRVEIILVPNMNVFDVVLDASEETRQQAEQRRLLERRLITALLLLSRLLGIRNLFKRLKLIEHFSAYSSSHALPLHLRLS